MWFKRQAELMESEKDKKLRKENEKKIEMEKKQKEEEVKKIHSTEAFKLWLERKSDELPMKNESRGGVGEKIEGRKLSAIGKKTKFVIGPYTNARSLKDIQKRISINFKNDSNVQSSRRVDQKQSEQNEDQDYSADNMEDSLQELSSIKKDTPVQEDQDYE
jgi:hypothetical protein